MGIKRWGKTVAGALLTAAVMTAVSGCGGEADANTKKPPAWNGSPTPSLRGATLVDAARIYREDLQELTLAGCPADCGAELTEVFNNALLLRDRMQKSGAPQDTYAEAYRLIGNLEKGYISSVKLGEEESRAPVLGPARELNDWLRGHPVQ
ncbi:hypothetical protein OH782_42350 (plasmid) [Streptomyces sp. NBC_01544]|uniref:hypothetical protein n=1 Tax=Streptomyces sp. NBC_01544 TaxID=2975871 RepID=UPI002F90D782